MIRRQSLSAYTPSNTDPAVLERIFVQREKLLNLLISRYCNSIETGDKYHALLIGPRGSGKTHFVSLVEWKLRQREELADKLCICWLGEDDSFTGLIYLAFGIAQQLANAYPEEFPQDFKSAVRGLPQDEAAIAVLRNVVDKLSGRTLLLITENLDKTFPSMSESGRVTWRAFLQETRCIATLATSQQLFDDVSKRNEAFFGFFEIQHFEALTVEHALELIKRIAEETFIDERTVSKQLSKLKDRHYVHSERRGKESYYEILEPLMQLSLKAKSRRVVPLRMSVRFLKAWFSQYDSTSLHTVSVGESKQHALDFAGVPNDILSMVLSRSLSDWTHYGSKISDRTMWGDLVDLFGFGLTRSIELLDQGDFTASQRLQWLSIWQEVQKTHDALAIPLQCLDAAVACINQ